MAQLSMGIDATSIGGGGGYGHFFSSNFMIYLFVFALLLLHI